MKTRNIFTPLALSLALAVSSLNVVGCKYFSSADDYATLSGADLTAFVDTMPEPQKRQIAQNAQQRKGMIDQFKKMFTFAQAGLAAGLNKGDDYTKSLALAEARMLAQEFSKKNESFQVDKAMLDGYIAAHQKEFDADVAFITRNSPQKPDAAQLETMKPQWSELQLRAEKARAAGLAKDPAVMLQLKFARANLLADLYAKKVEDETKLSDADKKAWLEKHPEANPDSIKNKVAELLNRIKKGETFEKIADEVNEDGTKGQGGDLNWFGKGAMDPDFEKAAFALQAGQITQEPVKSKFGFHLIKVEGRRKAADKPKVPPGTPGSANDVLGKDADPNAEEVHAKHIYLSTSAADEMLAQEQQEKMKRAMEDAQIKFPVKAPDDFLVKVEGLNKTTGTPLPGGGGSMKQIDPNANK